MKLTERQASAAWWFASMGCVPIAAWAILGLSDLIGTHDVTEAAGQPEAAVLATGIGSISIPTEPV